MCANRTLFIFILGQLAAIILGTACVHSAPAPQDSRRLTADIEPLLAPRSGATLEKPNETHPQKNVCGDPDNYPPLAFDLPQLSASQLLALFNSPSNVRELLSNIKLLSERDLLVQSAFFDDDVLLKFFGASEISWEKSWPPSVFSAPNPQLAIGPSRIGHIKALHGQLANVTVRVVSNRNCKGWRQMPAPRGWWPPVTFQSGHMQIDVSSLESLNVGIVRDVFGPDLDEASNVFIQDSGGSVSYPGHLAYKSLEKVGPSAAFSNHKIEFVPEQTGYERRGRSSDGRVFASEAKLLWINVFQEEREL